MNKEIEILIDGKPTKMKLPNDMQDSKIVIENGKVFAEIGVVDYINNLKEENQRLKERIEYLERSNNRREDTIMGLRDEITEQKDYENILNELEKWLKERSGDISFAYKHTLNKLKELKESDK